MKRVGVKDKHGIGAIFGMHPLVRGQWKDAVLSYQDSPHVICSVCGEYYWRYFKKFNFCPNCGADMRRSANNE